VPTGVLPRTGLSSRLASFLRGRGLGVVEAREPGGTLAGEAIREFIKVGAPPLSPPAELLLFLAARAQLVEEVVVPALREGKVVLLDRFVHSTLAYQGYGLGVDLGGETAEENVARLRELCLMATKGLWPRRVLLLDLPAEEGLARRRLATPIGDRIEDRDLEFHRRVRQGYLTLAAAEPEVFLVLDGRGSPERIAAAIEESLAKEL